MSEVVLGSGGALDVLAIGEAVNKAAPNSYVRLQMDLSESPANWMLEQVASQLKAAGVQGVSVTSHSPNITIQWWHSATQISQRRIAIAPLVIIGIVAASLAVIALVVIGWRVLNEIPEPVKGPLLTIGLIAGIVLIGIIAFRQIKTEVTGGYRHAAQN